jgi:hypothetical protein
MDPTLKLAKALTSITNRGEREAFVACYSQFLTEHAPPDLIDAALNFAREFYKQMNLESIARNQ